jgi:hypothetical protein
MQSSHPYVANQDVSGTLLAPIIVSSGSNTSISYQDVAIVQPNVTGAVFGQPGFNDYVVVEATKDGLSWTPIANGYNASANVGWLAAFNAATNGAPALTVTETVDLKNNFAAGDTLLFRFRLHANSDATTGWGWSVDNLYIQQQPTAVAPPVNTAEFSAYPNPTSGKLYLNFTLPAESDVILNAWDIDGRSVMTHYLENQSPGGHQLELNLGDMQDGIYILRMKTKGGERSVRIVIKK